MAFKRTILSQILQEVKQYNFKKFVDKYKGDHKVSKVTCFTLLIAMIFAYIKNNKTLRDIAFGFESAQCSLYHLGVKSMKRSTISDAIRNRPAQVYEGFYSEIIKSLDRSERRKLGEQVTITNAVVHDMNAIRGTIEFKKGDIYVYDRGYACYNYLYEIASAKAFFVTRLKSNWKIRVIKNKKVSKCKGIRKDQIIKVSGNKKNKYPEQLRLVTFYHEESKRVLKFLTNNFRLSAKKIADIYKMRWQIELFFKWIKQHLKIKTFLSTSPNGVKIQIWSALITYIMLYMVKSRLLCEMDIFEIARRIQDHLFSKIDLYDLLTYQIPKKIKPDNYGQLELEYA